MTMMTISALMSEIERISDKLIVARDAALTAALSDLVALGQRCEASGIPFVIDDHVEMLRGLVGQGTGYGDEGNDIFCDDEEMREDDVLPDLDAEWDVVARDMSNGPAADKDW